MFRNQTIQRVIAALVLTTFTSLTMTPLTAAAQARNALDKAGLLPRQKDEGVIGNAKRYIDKLAGNGRATAASGAEERFAQLLNDIHEDLKAAVPQTALPKEARMHSAGKNGGVPASFSKDKAGGMETRAIGPNMRIDMERGKAASITPLPGTDVAARIHSIKGKAAEIKGLYAEIDRSFQDTERHLKEAKLPQEILDRHAQAVSQYETRKAEFERLTARIEQVSANSGEQQAALADLGSFMAKYPNAKPHQYADPNKLPFGTPGGKVRAPFETKAQYQASLFLPKYEKVMLASLSLDGVQLAQATLPEVPNAADTAETEDVQMTPAIRNQAAALNHNPVQIYNWVRNNIQFIPSYGSIQGADLTLMNRRGNAFDTASLLIALLRASGIPARYVYGTIDVPAEQAMNWVGGVTKAEAAQSLLGQGGIPNIGIASGGVIKTIRLEHVWVEAYVDYLPSRGAINQNPNTWVPLDASFKQYAFTPGMDIKNKVPVDGQALLAQIQQGATIDSTNGYVQNLNQANLQTQLTNYQAQVQNYITSQNANATVGDVLGTQTIVKSERPILLGSLSYRLVATGNRFQSLPDNLRWKFKTNIYPADGISDSSSPIIEINQSTPKLAGKKLTLSFVPAGRYVYGTIDMPAE